MSKKKKGDDPQQQLINLQAQQLAAQVANWAATLDFQKERFRLLEMPQFQQGLQLDVDKFAWQKGEDTWKRAYQESLVTGYYNGQPTTQWLLDQAKLTGSYNGERTLEGKLTDAQIQDMHDKMKLANDEFLSNTTGYFNGQKTFDREKFESAQALEGWKFIATLSGPQNAFKQARAIATMPGGQSQLMDAFAGKYMLPTSTAVGAGGAGSNNPQGQLNDLIGRPGSYQTPAPVVQPPGGMYAPQPVVPPDSRPPVPGPTPGPMPAPAPVTPQPVVPPDPRTTLPPQPWGPDQAWFNPIPRPADVDYAVTTQRWNAAHPGFVLDSSALGYHALDGSPVGPYAYLPGGVAPGTPAPGALPAPTPGYTQPPASSARPPGTTYSPAGVQAPANVWNYSGTADGSVSAYPPGVYSPAGTPDVSSQQPLAPSSVATVVNQPYQYAAAPTTNTGTPLPNQINGQNYQNAYQYQRDLAWADYEDQGWDKSLAQEAFLKSLPQYGGPTKGAVAF